MHCDSACATAVDTNAPAAPLATISPRGPGDRGFTGLLEYRGRCRRGDTMALRP